MKEGLQSKVVAPFHLLRLSRMATPQNVYRKFHAERIGAPDGSGQPVTLNLRGNPFILTRRASRPTGTFLALTPSVREAGC